MSTLTFDTLKFANQLKAAGVPADHAEAEADALAEVLETNLGELATKEDLRATKEDLRHEINDLRKDLRHEINDLRKDLRHEIKESAASLKFELLKWLIGLAVAQAGLLIGILKFFPINS